MSGKSRSGMGALGAAFGVILLASCATEGWPAFTAGQNEEALMESDAVASAAEPALPVTLDPGSAETGARLFSATCVYCHDDRGFGTRMLKARLGDREAVLQRRTDMPSEYIRLVVRRGVGAMPWYTRVELTDQELEDVVAYLTRDNPRAGDAVATEEEDQS